MSNDTREGHGGLQDSRTPTEWRYTQHPKISFLHHCMRCDCSKSESYLKNLNHFSGCPCSRTATHQSLDWKLVILEQKTSTTVAWGRGHASADDEWLRLEELAHCPEKVAGYDAAAPHRGIARRPGPAAGPAVPPVSAPAPAMLVAPAGFRLAAPAEVLTGAALIGQATVGRPRVGPRHRGPPHPGRRVHARGALQPHVGARVGGDALASRPGLARPGRALGAPLTAACALAWLPFSRTPIMGLPAREGPGLGLSGAAQTNQCC